MEIGLREGSSKGFFIFHLIIFAIFSPFPLIGENLDVKLYINIRKIHIPVTDR